MRLSCQTAGLPTDESRGHNLCYENDLQSNNSPAGGPLLNVACEAYVACVRPMPSSRDTVGTEKVPNRELHCSKGLRGFHEAEYCVGTVCVVEPL